MNSPDISIVWKRKDYTFVNIWAFTFEALLNIQRTACDRHTAGGAVKVLRLDHHVQDTVRAGNGERPALLRHLQVRVGQHGARAQTRVHACLVWQEWNGDVISGCNVVTSVSGGVGNAQKVAWPWNTVC